MAVTCNRGYFDLDHTKTNTLLLSNIINLPSCKVVNLSDMILQWILHNSWKLYVALQKQCEVHEVN